MAHALLVLLFILPMAYATDYPVGDSAGWTTGVDYKVWAASKTFTVGDNLLFTYTGSHTVDVVNQGDYDNCATSNALESYNDGNTLIKLNKTGSMYFLCPALGHCSQGMKLAVTVTDGSNTPGGAPTSTTPSPPTTAHSPPSPSGATGNFPSMNVMVLGASLLMVPMVALIG